MAMLTFSSSPELWMMQCWELVVCTLKDLCWCISGWVAGFFKSILKLYMFSVCSGVAELSSVEKSILNLLIHPLPAQVKSLGPPFIQAKWMLGCNAGLLWVNSGCAMLCWELSSFCIPSGPLRDAVICGHWQLKLKLGQPGQWMDSADVPEVELLAMTDLVCQQPLLLGDTAGS